METAFSHIAEYVLDKRVILPATGLLLLYYLGLGISRIYFSPIKHIPGPFMAKLTYWYEFYYDVRPHYGQYSWKIAQLHEKYGDIIRINPHQVHIADPDYYDTIYNQKRRDKWDWQYKSFLVDDSAFSTSDHELHRSRRGALNPFFSKAKVRTLQPQIEEVMKKLMDGFERYQKSGEPLPATAASAAIANDVAMDYAYGYNMHRIEAPGFDPEFVDTAVEGVQMANWIRHFPIILTIVQALPAHLAALVSKEVADYAMHSKNVIRQVAKIKEECDKPDYKPPERTTVFTELLFSDLPESEKRPQRLAQEAQLVLQAGTLTTTVAIMFAIYYLIKQPSDLRRLKEELATAIPDVGKLPNSAQLEQLPFLTGCVKEVLRLSHGVSTRLGRILPHESLTFTANRPNKPTTGKTYVIPPGTVVSMTMMLIHYDPDIFPDPMSFVPERWIDNPRLDRYMLAFSKGSRSCLGINLALAELHLSIAVIFRNYGGPETRFADDKGWLELYQTDEKDVEIIGDGFVPMFRRDSKGIQILVH